MPLAGGVVPPELQPALCEDHLVRSGTARHRPGNSLRLVPGDEIVLTVPRRKLAFLVVVGAVFTAGGAWMVAADVAAGWFIAVFFGLCLLVGMALMIRPSRLRIDRTGMTSFHLWRSDRFEFADCSEFSTWRNPAAPSQRLVVFDWTGVRHRRLARLSATLAGRNSALPDTYGMNADELVHLLNERRSSVT